ncbi:hypothetical protein BZG36_04152 [Bifiguratus adelaidae]|uniref:Uncharacterized protein n=1 Tax=Bifiguratus adelaidae TaxID=1938954 RepID=A0A261XZD6_9FUNG|nr:hypothetical protein BZG36_04152 [Bifiguratus adelaidae]
MASHPSAQPAYNPPYAQPHSPPQPYAPPQSSSSYNTTQPTPQTPPNTMPDYRKLSSGAPSFSEAIKEVFQPAPHRPPSNAIGQQQYRPMPQPQGSSQASSPVYNMSQPAFPPPSSPYQAYPQNQFSPLTTPPTWQQYPYQQQQSFILQTQPQQPYQAQQPMMYQPPPGQAPPNYAPVPPLPTPAHPVQLSDTASSISSVQSSASTDTLRSPHGPPTPRSPRSAPPSQLPPGILPVSIEATRGALNDVRQVLSLVTQLTMESSGLDVKARTNLGRIAELCTRVEGWLDQTARIGGADAPTNKSEMSQAMPAHPPLQHRASSTSINTASGSVDMNQRFSVTTVTGGGGDVTLDRHESQRSSATSASTSEHDVQRSSMMQTTSGPPSMPLSPRQSPNTERYQNRMPVPNPIPMHTPKNASEQTYGYPTTPTYHSTDTMSDVSRDMAASSLSDPQPQLPHTPVVHVTKPNEPDTPMQFAIPSSPTPPIKPDESPPLRPSSPAIQTVKAKPTQREGVVYLKDDSDEDITPPTTPRPQLALQPEAADDDASSSGRRSSTSGPFRTAENMDDFGMAS